MLHLVNMQEPLRPERDLSGLLKVHSIFPTIQGEGPFAGEAALFIRLYGCNLQCPGCDTDYTSKVQQVMPAELLHVIRTFYDWQPNDDLSDYPLVVITGGEPFRQNITPLVNVLLAHYYKVQIETNGVLYPGDDFPFDHEDLTIVCSPKTGKIHPRLMAKVHAYKYVLSHGGVYHDGLPERALYHEIGGLNSVARPPVGWT
jgi:7-carboxy-7-deazaguanine synthase